MHCRYDAAESAGIGNRLIRSRIPVNPSRSLAAGNYHLTAYETHNINPIVTTAAY